MPRSKHLVNEGAVKRALADIPLLDVSIAAQETSSAGYGQCVRQFKVLDKPRRVPRSEQIMSRH